MKLTLIALGLVAAGLIAIPASSHAANGDNGGFFINGNVGQSNLDKGVYTDNDTGYGANIGYRWAINPSVALGVEGGYTKLGTFSPTASFDVAGLQSAKIEGWNLGVNGHFNITPNWYVSGRAGLFRADLKGSALGPDLVSAPIYVDDTSNKYYAGVGLGYDFSNNVSIGVNYDYYKANKDGLNFNPDLVSVSAEYRF